MSSTVVIVKVPSDPSDISLIQKYNVSDCNFIFVTAYIYAPRLNIPVAGILVNPLAINHEVNVSLLNGVSDLVYKVANALTFTLPSFIIFNECM